MSFSFSLPVADPEAAFQKASSAIANLGGTVSGNAASGQFSGKTPLGAVAGSYAFERGSLQVSVHQKPFLAPESLIKSKVAEFFA
jgi:hypothetical protein